MFNKEELLAKVNQVTGKDYTHCSYLLTIADLIQVIEHQQKELKEAQCRELSYIDDIEQMEGMLSQANAENKLLQEKLLNCKRKSTYTVYEENLKLAAELARLKGVLPV
ncbi:hypothetical protein ABC255_09515 [Neobacillus sp. 3P2-tot-E-2]|uniref:hypothetical protein n=1 Tax=Neobacillus sp. 3P2-tot-E-2 TaxID=3132212 RepID=UPI0039A16372